MTVVRWLTVCTYYIHFNKIPLVGEPLCVDTWQLQSLDFLAWGLKCGYSSRSRAKCMVWFGLQMTDVENDFKKLLHTNVQARFYFPRLSTSMCFVLNTKISVSDFGMLLSKVYRLLISLTTYWVYSSPIFPLATVHNSLLNIYLNGTSWKNRVEGKIRP